MATQVGCPFGPERTSSVYRWQSTLIPSRRIVHILCDDPRWLQGIPHIVADWMPLPHQGMGNQRQRFLEAGHVTLCDNTTRSVCVLFERMLGVVDATCYLAASRCDPDYELAMSYCKRGYAILCDTSSRTFVSVFLCVRSISCHIIWQKYGFCRKVRFLGKIQKSGIRNSMTYRLPIS